MTCGCMAADAIAEGLAKDDTSEAQLRKWEPAFTEGMERIRRLVCEFYDGLSFGRFVRKHPHLKGSRHRRADRRRVQGRRRRALAADGRNASRITTARIDSRVTAARAASFRVA